MLEVDQTPIGKTPRSCPATYIGFLGLRAQTVAKHSGQGARQPGRFGFNTGEGAAACEGQGMRTIEMNFLPDVKVPLRGLPRRRFNPQTLTVTWRGKTTWRCATDGGG